jgi:hypothetical protein
MQNSNLFEVGNILKATDDTVYKNLFLMVCESSWPELPDDRFSAITLRFDLYSVPFRTHAKVWHEERWSKGDGLWKQSSLWEVTE